jgi:hypothetical protein
MIISQTWDVCKHFTYVSVIEKFQRRLLFSVFVASSIPHSGEYVEFFIHIMNSPTKCMYGWRKRAAAA